MTLTPEFLLSATINAIIAGKWAANKIKESRKTAAKQAREAIEEELSHNFIRAIATNHFPHIYNALEKIADKLGVDIGETPQIEFIDLEQK